ncbi:thiaminase II [Veronia pacifica]|uniref:Aminopyrimidine aminohydrolase n=1 Tax=Veronia pacifica TaxID=1080227 RepID=A0A1C3ERM1_9GAMM|nr:thiaminase II [Veronia pacifica]ODA35871.1 thiaminase II [Veronia pacifica]
MKYTDLIAACQQEWQEYTEHEFVSQLADGTLDQTCYLHYLKQDFLFLKQYARAYALAIYKARTLSDMRQALPSVHALLEHEINHHITYCSEWGITEADLEKEPEDAGTVAYTRYVLDTGMAGDMLDLFAALAPCSIGYAQIGKRLLSNTDASKLADNPYASWIKLYGGEEFQQSVGQGTEQIDALLADVDINSRRGQQLIQVFATATRMEVAFWQQGLDILR